MSNAVAVQVADAIVSEMAGQSWSQPITPERAWAELTEFENFPAGSLKVVVVPVSWRNPPLTRGGLRGYEYQPHILVYAKPADLEVATLDPYALLAEQISDYWAKFPRLANYTGPAGRDGAKVTDSAVETLCDPDLLLSFGIFASDIALNVWVAR